jgi:hypothetical protein
MVDGHITSHQHVIGLEEQSREGKPTGLWAPNPQHYCSLEISFENPSCQFLVDE